MARKKVKVKGSSKAKSKKAVSKAISQVVATDAQAVSSPFSPPAAQINCMTPLRLIDSLIRRFAELERNPYAEKSPGVFGIMHEYVVTPAIPKVVAATYTWQQWKPRPDLDFSILKPEVVSYLIQMPCEVQHNYESNHKNKVTKSSTTTKEIVSWTVNSPNTFVPVNTSRAVYKTILRNAANQWLPALQTLHDDARSKMVWQNAARFKLTKETEVANASLLYHLDQYKNNQQSSIWTVGNDTCAISMISSLVELKSVIFDERDESITIDAENIHLHLTAFLSPETPITFVLKLQGKMVFKDNNLDLSKCKCTEVFDLNNEDTTWRNIPSHWLTNTEDGSDQQAQSSSSKAKSSASQGKTYEGLCQTAKQKMPTLLIEALGKMATNLHAYKKQVHMLEKNPASPFKPFYEAKPSLKRKRNIKAEDIPEELSVSKTRRKDSSIKPK